MNVTITLTEEQLKYLKQENDEKLRKLKNSKIFWGGNEAEEDKTLHDCCSSIKYAFNNALPENER